MPPVSKVHSFAQDGAESQPSVCLCPWEPSSRCFTSLRRWGWSLVEGAGKRMWLRGELGHVSGPWGFAQLDGALSLSPGFWEPG